MLGRTGGRLLAYSPSWWGVSWEKKAGGIGEKGGEHTSRRRETG
jgi:hypothetical protein